MFDLTGGRGLGFPNNITNSDTEVREAILNKLNVMNLDIAKVKAFIGAMQNVSAYSALARSYINSDVNIPSGSLISRNTVLTQMKNELDGLEKSITYLETAVSELKARAA